MNPYVDEARKLGKLAAPLVLASLVSMAISITDVLMMGWLGSTELAAGAATSDFYSIVFYLLGGILAAVSPLVAQARGAMQTASIGRITRQGLLMAALLGLIGSLLIWHTDVLLQHIQVNEAILPHARAYAPMMALVMIPMLGVMVCHHYLSAHDRGRILLIATAVSLPVNALGNYFFMFGPAGLPKLGLAGAGLSSCIAGLLMLLIMLGELVRDARRRGYHLFDNALAFEPHVFREILRLGLPIGILSLGEVGVILLSTVVMGVFGVEALAAHAVALRCAGVVYALPLGLAQAATIRIALAAGASDRPAMARTARTAVRLALLVGMGYVIAIWLWRHDIARVFLGPVESSLLLQATLLLGVMAGYQPFQCLGTISAGILRGMKDTRLPMFISLGSYWGVGGLMAGVMIFIFKLDALGIWFGLAAGAISYGCGMLIRLRHNNRQVAGWPSRLAENPA